MRLWCAWTCSIGVCVGEGRKISSAFARFWNFENKRVFSNRPPEPGHPPHPKPDSAQMLNMPSPIQTAAVCALAAQTGGTRWVGSNAPSLPPPSSQRFRQSRKLPSSAGPSVRRTRLEAVGRRRRLTRRLRPGCGSRRDRGGAAGIGACKRHVKLPHCSRSARGGSHSGRGTAGVTVPAAACGSAATTAAPATQRRPRRGATGAQMRIELARTP